MTSFPLAVILQGVDKLTPVLARGAGGLSTFASKASSIGRTLNTRVTLPTLAAGAAVLKVGLDWERGWRDVAGSLNLTTDQLDQLKTSARDTSADLGGPTGALGVMRGLVNEGATLNDVLEQTPAALNFIKILGGDASEGMSTLSDTMAAVGAKTAQTTRFIDMLVTATAGSPKRIRDMTAALQNAGQVAQPLGVDFRDLFAVLRGFESEGIEAARAGNLLRVMLTRLEDPGEEAISIFERLRIRRADVFNEKGELRDLIGTLELLNERGASSLDFIGLFGSKAGPQLAAMLGEGIKGLRQTRDELDVTGAAASRAQQMTGGAIGGWEAFLADAKGLAIAIGESGLLEWFAKGIRKVSSWTRELAKSNPELLKLGSVFAIAAAAAGPLITVLSGIARAGSFALSTMEKISGLATKLAPKVTGALPWLGKGAMRTLGAAGTLLTFDAQPPGYVEENARINATEREARALAEQLGVDVYEGSRWWEESSRFMRRRLPELQEMMRQRQTSSAPGGGGETTVRVKFENMPKGARATVDPYGSSDVDLILDTGYVTGY